MEKRFFNALFVKGAFFSALVAFFCAALLTCSNSAGGSDAPVSQKDSPLISSRPGYVILNGTVSASGAVPQILSDAQGSSENSQNELSRSAYPGIDASGADATMEYFATATCGNDVVNGTFGSGSEAKKFGIELAASKTWSVVVGVRSKTPDAEGNRKIYLQSKPWSVTPDPADPTISRNFVPVPIVTSAGKGTIELAVNYIHSVFDTSARFVSGPSGYDSLPIISSTEGNDQIYKVLNVPSGTYELCIDIMEIQGGNKFLVYSSIQTVSVADGMTTNAWVSDGSGIIDSNGTFKFNDSNATALKQSYLSSNIYVGKYSDESNSQIADASDTNSGNWMAPLASINQAVNRINSAGKSNIDYVVHLNGKIQSDDLNNTTRITASTVTATHAKSITIVGTTGPSKDILEATKQGTPALMVTTSVPIIIKNIKLDGYSGAGSSAALDASGGAKVTIESGVEIADADLGVRVADTGSDGTTVTMKDGTISGNVTAVDLQGGDFILQGGSIPYDSANKKNYVKTASEKFVTAKGDLAAVDASGGKIAIEPAQKKRGVKLVDVSAATASDADIEAKFMVYDPTISAENPSGDEWQLVSAAADRALKTNAPIYVGQDPNGHAGSNDNPGTKSAPYYEIKRACEDMDDADMPYTINVRGKLPAQIIPSTLSKESNGIYKAKSVLIKGVKPIPTSGENAGIPQDAIDGGGSGGTALTVASAVPITIQNLKITGGADSQNGGGIYMNPSADVTILGGALITANKAKNHGGGIYCANGRLTIKGGKISANEITGSSGNRGGIGLYAAGNSVIEMTGGEISGNKDTSHVDVVGGGVKLEGSASFKMSGGEVKDNQVVRAGGNFYVSGGDSGPSVILSGSAKITGGVADSSSFSDQDAIGGAVWLEGAGSRLDMSGGEISGNSAKCSSSNNACAGIYVRDATFTMTGGKISGNNVLGGNIQGGAVRLNGKFNISGSAYIPYGDAIGKNDVYLCDGKTVTIAAALTPPSGVTKVAAITPSVFKRGTEYLSANSSNATALSDAIGKFKLSQDDSGWDRSNNISVASETAKKVWITSPIYVVDATDSGTTRPTGFNKGKTSGANGTKTSPYPSIAAAALASDLAEADGKITVAGTLTGVQTISSVVSGVSSVTLKGYDSNATINGNAAGSALTINAEKTFTIQQLKITNGRAAAGGGINIASGSGTIVNLDSGAIVYSNKATSGGSGAGVYVASGATLNIKTGSEIYSNVAFSGTINGGGVYNGGTTTTSGGQIYNNSANNGGGVYNEGSLYVTGTSLIGDGTANNNTATGANPGSNCSNLANYGGGIYNNGNLYFGCDSNGSSSTTGYALTASYGVRRNNATQGGGIYLAGGTFKAASGTVSYNHAAYGGAIYVSGGVNNLGAVTLASNNVSNSGGALYLANSTSLTVSGTADFNANSVEITSGSNNPRGGAVYNSGTLEITASATFKNNVAKVTGDGTGSAYGGAIYNGGTLTMTAGTIGATSNLNSVSNTVSGSASKAYGGAIYQNGTFNISASAYVYPGSEKTNDVYLPSNKKVTVDSTWSGSQASNKMTLTPSTWARGSQVLAGTKAAYYYTYFNTSDSEWSVGYKESSWTLTDDLKTRIGADIYVAGSENRASGISAPSETASERIGTKLKPFNSIEEGVKACWNTTLPFTVKFSGTITGTAQTIPAGSTSTGGLASAITIEGVQGNSKDIINRNLSTATDSGTALTINTATPVTIKKIKITGGYNRNASGGGIRANVAGASLTLSEGALVTANNVTSSTTYDSGGGVYIEGTSTSPATLIMESDATISGNDSGQGSGGGVGLKYATLCMIGNALIGDKDATSTATGNSGKHSNSAQSGGGVYVGTGSKLRLGYATPTATTGTSLDAAYGIRYNYVYNAGGGVFVEAGSSVEIASGSISCNGTIANATYKNGGGIYLNETATLTMTGGTIAKNKAYDGGGVYLYGNTSTGSSIVMSGGTIGDSSSGVTSAATGSDEKFSNYAAHDGGGIYAATAKNTVTLNGGNVSYNYSAGQGGGIYTKTGTTFKANAKYNGAGGSGGGIYSASGATLTMTAGTIYGNKSYVTSTDSSVQKNCGGGGVWFDGTFKMGGGTIQGNTAVWYGGGVGTANGTLYMYGSAVIGDSSKSAVPNASSTTSPTANRAKYGAGFAGTIAPGLYLGYSAGSWSGGTFSGTASSLASGGICYNYASEHGGGIYYTGNTPLVIKTGNISYNKAAGTTGKGGGIYTESKLQMSGGTIAGNAGTNGGAVYLNNCVYEASGSIYIPYDSSSSSVHKENVVTMNGNSSKITVTGSLTYNNSKIMTVEPRAWAIGTLVADKGTSLDSSTFKTAIGKIGIVKNGIYSKIEPVGGTYNDSSAVTKGVVGIDFSTVTQSDILSYMSGKTWSLASSEPYPSNELNYFFLCDKTAPNSKYAILKVIHYNSETLGDYYANSVLIGSTNQESTLTTVSYDTSTSDFITYATWNPFKVTSPTTADYITVFLFNHYVTMQLGTNYLGWYKVQ